MRQVVEIMEKMYEHGHQMSRDFAVRRIGCTELVFAESKARF